MTSSIGKSYKSDYRLINSALKKGAIDKTTLEAVQRLRILIPYLSPLSSRYKKITMLCNGVDFHIAMAARQCGLYFRVLQKLALISGAGISGLAAAFELRAKGFNVVIVEKRQDFSRFNIINLSVETQVFLKKFNLLEKFEKCVAARITEHNYLLIKKKGPAYLGCSDVRQLSLDKSPSFEPKDIKKLFNEDGIYSVPIGVLQNFLAENALERGVKILGDATIRVLSRRDAGGVSKVEITPDRIVQPDLFFVAEGTHSPTALELGMGTKKVRTACSGENWIFGNLNYSGKKTFVISLIDVSGKTLRIANVIFNARSGAINIAVSSDKGADEARIRREILQVADVVFNQRIFPLERMTIQSLTIFPKPVPVINRTSHPFSMGNVFCIGDSAGSSSPLAGLGGTLGLTLVPPTIRRLSDDYLKQSKYLHKNFRTFSKASTGRWIQKSQAIKEHCMSIFDKEQRKAI